MSRNVSNVQSLPKLDGSILHLPDQLYAGDLRHVVLKLSNQSEFPVKVIFALCFQVLVPP